MIGSTTGRSMESTSARPFKPPTKAFMLYGNNSRCHQDLCYPHLLDSRRTGPPEHRVEIRLVFL